MRGLKRHEDAIDLLPGHRGEKKKKTFDHN